MQNFIVKSHNPKSNHSNPHFFILSKGLNSGKPLEQPCPNCFVLEFQNQEEKENHYWLAYSLWQSNFWRYYLVGSVIEFLRITDFKNFFIQKSMMLQENGAQHLKNIRALKMLKEKESEFYKSINLLNQIRSAILQQYAKT